MVIFNKYKLRSSRYHWQQVSRDLFNFNAFVISRYQQVIKLIPKKKNQRILDIGCGDGVLLSLIKNARLYGVDLDQDSLDFAATKIKAKLVKASAEKLPFKNNLFDVVIATEIIEHLSKPELMLKEIKRVLKPNGRVIISTPNQLAFGLTDRLHVQEFSAGELQQLLQSEFKSVKISQSHPLFLKKIYSITLFKFGRFHFDFFRWLINMFVLLTDFNPFLIKFGRSAQLFVTGRK